MAKCQVKHVFRGYPPKFDFSNSTLFIYDGVSDFEAPHQNYFNLKVHRWTENFLDLAEQPLLCRGFEQVSQRRQAWAVCYYLGYLKPEGSEAGLYFVKRSDIVQMRKDVRSYLKSIEVDGSTIDAPPCAFDKMKPFYNRQDKRLHFGTLEMLRRFLIYCWGVDAPALMSRTGELTFDSSSRAKTVDI